MDGMNATSKIDWSGLDRLEKKLATLNTQLAVHEEKVRQHGQAIERFAATVRSPWYRLFRALCR